MLCRRDGWSRCAVLMIVECGRLCRCQWRRKLNIMPRVPGCLYDYFYENVYESVYESIFACTV